MPTRLPLKTYLRYALQWALPWRLIDLDDLSKLHAREGQYQAAREMLRAAEADRDAWKARWEQASADGLRAAADRDHWRAKADGLGQRLSAIGAIVDRPISCPPTTPNP